MKKLMRAYTTTQWSTERHTYSGIFFQFEFTRTQESEPSQVEWKIFYIRAKTKHRYKKKESFADDNITTMWWSLVKKRKKRDEIHRKKFTSFSFQLLIVLFFLFFLIILRTCYGHRLSFIFRFQLCSMDEIFYG